MRRWLTDQVFFPLAAMYDREPQVPGLIRELERLARLSPEAMQARQLERTRGIRR